MKKLLMIAVAAFMVTISANAQQMFLKPMVGGTLSTVTGDYTDNAKMKLGLVAGAEFGYDFTENMGLTAGLLYTMEGSKTDAADYNENLHYLNIPILFNYYIIPGLAVKAGVQPGFLVRAKYDDTDIKDLYKKFDFAIPLGLSYEFSDFVIDARYNLSLSKLPDVGDAKAYNSVIMLTLGYKIPF
jgi:hypothetical protein